jgi:hypothetical protein
MTSLEKFFHDVHEIHSSRAAVDETPYYGSLETLFNEIGKTLETRVRCIIHPKDRGAGQPDGGFFTIEQFDKKGGHELKQAQIPSRGAIEVKPPREEATQVALGEQVGRYLARYRQVLVTNLRQFVLMGHDADSKPCILEQYELAESEKAFWIAASQPQKTNDLHGVRFTEYLKRVMLHAAPLDAPEDVAFFLASYAREALARIGLVGLGPLKAVRSALEEALGLKFEGEKGEHFFRSSLVQTLFYGVFSAWVLWARKHPPASKDRFDWNLSARLLKVPVIRKLFHEVAEPGQLENLKLNEVLDWTAAVLNRVDRPSFFAKFEESQAVQYFYEPFLEAFDPELRKQLGVWYTPREIVQYMVARVDDVLREELGLADGLADKNVFILDPCCGTGSFLVEVLRKIHTTLKERGNDALIASDLKDAAKDRVFGFEILPAPFVVSHLQLGLLLDQFGASLSGGERAGVYLTNALTGWEPPTGPKQHLIFSELEEERDAAEHVKQDVPILVILGNPPYNGFAGVAVKEERALTDSYRMTKKAPAPQGQGLNDLYVRFFRMAEKRIVEKTGKGVVCFISNYSWLDGLSFTAMRERYLEVFERIWVDNLHGDRIISEYAPDGQTSETVFAVRGTSPGIKIGTAISLLSRSTVTKKLGPRSVLYRDFDEGDAEDRRTRLLASIQESEGSPKYQRLKPVLELGLPLKPLAAFKGYLDWPLLPDLFPVSFPGVQTSRDDLLVDVSREKLFKRMENYFDATVSHAEMQHEAPTAMRDTARFQAESTRDYLRKRGFLPQNIVTHLYRPFDTRWLYWEPETKLLDEKRAEYFAAAVPDNIWVAAAQKNRRDFDPPVVTSTLCSRHVVERGANLFPLYFSHPQASLLQGQGADNRTRNISPRGEDYLSAYHAGEADLFYHVPAILYSLAYRTENSGALRQDWPRIPLPNSKNRLAVSAELGRRIAALLDTEPGVQAIRVSENRPELKLIGTITRIGGGNLTDSDLSLTVGWGHIGKGGINMPGKGRLVERDYSKAERESIGSGTKALDLSIQQVFSVLGSDTCDIYLNDVAYWSNVPQNVWEYTIGGYQVIKKWLSYREAKLLGRPLTKDEVRYVQEMIRRIAAILLLTPALDANYQAIKGDAFSWALE